MILQVPLQAGHLQADVISVADIDGTQLRLAEFSRDVDGLTQTEASMSPLNREQALALAAAIKIIAEGLAP